MLIGIDASRATTAEKTGTENYSWNLIKALAKIEKKNHYILYFNKVPQFLEIGGPNFSARVIKAPRMWTQGRLAFECLINPPDVLFVPAHTIPVIRRPSLKTVVTIHDLGAEFLPVYHRFPQKFYLNWSTSYVAKHATHLLAVSKSTKKDLMKQFGVEEKRVSVVHEGIDTEVFSKRNAKEVEITKQKYGLNRRYILFVGTIQPRKNLVGLIQAFSKAKLRNTDLVLAGGRGWLDSDIYPSPEKQGIENRVKFLGFIPDEDLPALYSGAAAFTFPSLYEGFGLPILEAFACEVPVLTSKGGATEEIAGGAALLINPKNVDDISDGLRKVVEDHTLRASLIKKGQERVGQFSWEKTAIETLKVLEKVVGIE